MSSSPILDNDDILLIPAAEEAADTDPPTSSSIMHGPVYPRWTENPNRLAIELTSGPVTLPNQVIHMGQVEQPARRTVIQITGGKRGLYPPSADTPVSFTWAYAASCLVYWCFCWVIGSIAFMIATTGENHAHEGNIEKARSLRNVSLATSAVGVVIGIVLLVVIFVVILPVYG